MENIITSQDELYKASLFNDSSIKPAAKEVQDYAIALRSSKKNQNSTLKRYNAGFRRLPGTSLTNTRTGRILNILYLSRFIIRNKSEYYRLLQGVRDDGHWEPWLLFILEGVIQTSQNTIQLVEGIRALMAHYKTHIRSHLPKIYSQELLNNLFSHPYTKIEFVVEELGVTRITATKYLEQLVSAELLVKEKIGRSNYYINKPIFALLADNP